MKKFAMAAVAAAAMTAGVAQAYTVGTFSNGVVVPNVIHNGAADTTAVGLINQANGTIGVFWTFFDQDSNHVTDGCFPMTSKDFQPFVWSNESGTGLEGKRGYLVFAAGATTVGTATAACAASNAVNIATAGTTSQWLAANAFQVDLANKDLAFVPVIDGPLSITGNLSTMGPASLTRVAGAMNVVGGGDAVTGVAGSDAARTISMRYFVDGAAGGNDTRVVVWSTGSQKGTHTVNMFNDAQERKSVNFKLSYAELDWFDPETISGRPAAFVDGFIEWAPTAALPADYSPAAGTGSLFVNSSSSVFSYSLISAPAFGAVQSVLGAHN